MNAFIKHPIFSCKDRQTEGLYSLPFTAFLAFLFLFMSGCAKVGAPIGGDKDVNPPVFLESVPENRAVNYSGKEIEIEFDEFIQLKNQNSELVISPPLKKRPLLRIRDKSIRVDLNNELLPQTTYTLNFGNAIADFNEGNVLPDYEFVFSTGNAIDSLSVIGKAVNAFDKRPLKDAEVMVMLYENLADSAPLLEIPRYIGKVSKAGLFSINNIRADTFRILAIRDENNNLLYDPGSESVAFLDSLLVVDTMRINRMTFIKDTVRIFHPASKTSRSGKKAISVPADTTIVPGRELNALQVSLFYFKEESKKVILDTKERKSPESFYFVFSRPPHDSVKLTPLNFSPSVGWFIREESARGDTLTCWITDTLISRIDTLKMSLTYLTTDSTDDLTLRTDTVTMKYQKTAETGSGARRNRATTPVIKKDRLVLSASLANKGMQNLNKPVVITAGKPLAAIHPEHIEMFRMEDSLALNQPFTVHRDTLNLRSFKISTSWDEDRQYRLLLKPGAVTDIYGLVNDSLELDFATQKLDYYGRILLSHETGQYPLVLQLLDDKERVVFQQSAKQPGVTLFDYLPPRKYIIKAIIDKNGNGRWDTGNYLNHIQPEVVYYYRMADPVRSSWDHEVTWSVTE